MNYASIQAFLAILSPFLLLGLAGLGALYKMERDKRKEVETRLNENKAKIYSDFIRSYSSLFFKENGKEKTQSDLTRIAIDIQNFSRQALLYASDEVLERYHYMYRLHMKPPPDGDAMASVRENIRAFASVVKAIRKELGHTRTKINTDLIGGLLVTDYRAR